MIYRYNSFNKYDLLFVDFKVINMMVKDPIFAHSTLRYQRVLYIFDIIVAAFLHFFDCRLLKSFKNVIFRLTGLKQRANFRPSKRCSWLIALPPICGTHISIVPFDSSPSSVFVASIFIIHNDFHIHDLRILLEVALNQ